MRGGVGELTRLRGTASRVSERLHKKDVRAGRSETRYVAPWMALHYLVGDREWNELAWMTLTADERPARLNVSPQQGV